MLRERGDTPQNEAASAGTELRRRFSRHKLTGRKLKGACQFPPRSGPSARELWSGGRRRARNRR
jgi:hypothetical protein